LFRQANAETIELTVNVKYIWHIYFVLVSRRLSQKAYY